MTKNSFENTIMTWQTLLAHAIVNHNKVQEPPRAPKSGPHPRETTPVSGPQQKEITSQSVPHPEETEFKSEPHSEDTTSRVDQIKERSPSRRDHTHGISHTKEAKSTNAPPRWSLLRVVSHARGLFWMGISL